ncbi:MAG: putative toxin-antitoxin system toxin component, PIN family [Acidobacteria bacterium]|nr:putative toxin-antitoxin system toxin component, PIN family [Acidobacteriota bacterium]
MDTNQWVSGCLRRSGIPARIIDLAVEDKIQILTSPDIWEELVDVLQRPRLQKAIIRHGIRVAPWLHYVRRLARWTTGRIGVNAVAVDPDDNVVIACAIEGSADYIISGDQHLLNLKTYRGVSIVSPRQFLDLWFRSALH